MSEAAASFFGKASVLLEPIPGQDWSRGGGYSRTQGHDDRDCTGTSRHERTRMSRKSSCCLQRQRRCPRILSTTTRVGKSTRSGRQVLHSRVRGPSTVQAELVDETYGNHINRRRRAHDSGRPGKRPRQVDARHDKSGHAESTLASHQKRQGNPVIQLEFIREHDKALPEYNKTVAGVAASSQTELDKFPRERDRPRSLLSSAF